MASSSRSSLGYLPALDGVRALAVGAVVAYHLGFSWMPGGFIGVEVFFVLSGWLVCALLADEHRRTGRIDLRAFWIRRARRLLPAVSVVIAITLVAATWLHYARLGTLHADAAAALGYVLNWRLILDQQSYFEAAAAGPSPLQHLWSLSIEEQFYLVLPLGLGAVLAGRWTAQRAALVIVAAAAVVTVWRLGWLAVSTDTSRVYYGSDTRSAGLLVGVALGLVWVPAGLHRLRERWALLAVDAAALAGLTVLAWYAITIDERNPDAFGWSLLAVQIASVVVIATAVHPVQGLVARGLSVPVLRWIGQRSYGIYLWHWPIVVALARTPGGQPGSPLRTTVIVALSLIAAAVSYNRIEQPVRRRGLRVALGQAGTWTARQVVSRPVAVVTVVALLMLAPIATNLIVDDTGTTSATDPAAEQMNALAAQGATTPPSAEDNRAGPALPSTTAIGDSVMAGATAALRIHLGPGHTVDADPGRWMDEAPRVVHRLAQAGLLGKVVILHLGTNGPFPAILIDEMMQMLGKERQMLLVNAKVPQSWEAEVNDTLADVASRHPNARLVDWHRVPSNEPGLLLSDGAHLTASGADRYARFLREAVVESQSPRK